MSLLSPPGPSRASDFESTALIETLNRSCFCLSLEQAVLLDRLETDLGSQGLGKVPVARSRGFAASVLAGAAAAVGASACCAGPLLLVLLGVGGAWSSSLVALEPWQPFFMAATLGFLGFAFYRLYFGAAECAPGEACAVPDTRRRQQAIFWLVSLVAVTLMAMPLYAPIFY